MSCGAREPSAGMLAASRPPVPDRDEFEKSPPPKAESNAADASGAGSASAPPPSRHQPAGKAITMATGRGWAEWELQLGSGLRPSADAVGLREPGVQPSADQLQCARYLEDCPGVTPGCPVPLEGMPSEILLKILSYLDAGNLLCIGCVNRRFYHLASDNLIWVRIYSATVPRECLHWGASSLQRTALTLDPTSLGEQPAGHWKKACLSQRVSSGKATLTRLLRPVNPYKGLPARVKEAFRALGLDWVIILRDRSSQEHVKECVDLSIRDSSLTLVWHSQSWPPLATLSSMELCSVTPVFTNLYPPRASHRDMRRPRWRSVIAKYCLSNLTEAALMGCDNLVRVVHLRPGLLVGLWKEKEELAFVTMSLHLHQLMERITLGSATTPYEPPSHSSFGDDTSEYGLHGHQLHLELHSGRVSYLCSTFRNVFSKKGEGHIENGYLKIPVLSFENSTQHIPLIGKVGLAWRSNTFEGCVESCCIMDMTLQEGSGKPFWCLSSPVSMAPSRSPCDSCESPGQRYCMDCGDEEGRVHVDLVWMEKTQEFFVVSLALYLSVTRISHLLGAED
ncbi:F-box only protein 15 isoform X1 [Tenrec ecaudatus]|uniref:F-box only protein 15 isoform X1 n=1 Tax=Tenrec ecaudatus TaxID=94439 RepID=UPI003F5AB82D